MMSGYINRANTMHSIHANVEQDTRTVIMFPRFKKNTLGQPYMFLYLQRAKTILYPSLDVSFCFIFLCCQCALTKMIRSKIFRSVPVGLTTCTVGDFGNV